MASGGGALAPSDDQAMQIDHDNDEANLAVAAMTGVSDTPIIDSASEGGAENGAEEQNPDHSRVTTPSNSTKRVRSEEERRREKETANMADSAADEMAGGLVIADRPEATQQEPGKPLRVEDGQSARDQALPGAPALTSTQQHFRDRIDKLSDQYVPEGDPLALTEAQQKALERVPIVLQEPKVPGNLKNLKSQGA